jgi:hypothetical protein
MERTFLIIPVGELNKVDFTQVLETSPETVRRSVDGTKTFIKWEGVEPTFLGDIVGSEGPYTYSEIISILATPEWTDPNPFPIMG